MNKINQNIEELIHRLKLKLEKTIKLYMDIKTTYLKDKIKIQAYQKVIESIKNRVNTIGNLIDHNNESKKVRTLINREFNAISLIEHMLVRQISISR